MVRVIYEERDHCLTFINPSESGAQDCHWYPEKARDSCGVQTGDFSLAGYSKATRTCNTHRIEVQVEQKWRQKSIQDSVIVDYVEGRFAGAQEYETG